eukprot:1873237-Alexandrium_andersonii.AAC.1
MWCSPSPTGSTSSATLFLLGAILANCVHHDAEGLVVFDSEAHAPPAEGVLIAQEDLREAATRARAIENDLLRGLAFLAF